MNCDALAFALLAMLPLTAGAQSNPPRPAIKGISHVIVLSADLDASKSFYGGMIGWPASPALELGDAVHYQVGQRQYIELKFAPAHDPADRLEFIAFQTTDVRALRTYLAANGIRASDVSRHADGALSITVTDPAGYRVDFFQGGKLPPPSANAISTHIIHIGFTVRDQAAEAHFYQDVLGFRPYWHGWMKDDGHVDGQDDFKSYQVPDGTDWIEFMLAQGRNQPASGMAARNPHHFAPGVVSVDAAFVTLQQRGLSGTGRSVPQQGRDGKKQLNLFDPDGTRVELMNFTPNIEPCCSAFTAENPHAEP